MQVDLLIQRREQSKKWSHFLCHAVDSDVTVWCSPCYSRADTNRYCGDSIDTRTV